MNVRILQFNEYFSMKKVDEKFPFVVTGLLTNYGFGKWTLEHISEILGSKSLNVKVGFKKFYEMETECQYITCTLKDLLRWDSGDFSEASLLNTIPKNDCWLYLDYKDFSDLFPFELYPQLHEDFSWNGIILNRTISNDSTVWIGTAGAYTPLHYDSYGVNYVAQISGHKEWTLFPPDCREHLYPTRIPYEESSVFSRIDMMSPNNEKFPLLKHTNPYKVVLGPGDLLFVPRHWWHFVKSLDLSFTVNIWIDSEEDKYERLKESISRLLLFSLKNFEKDKEENWLNPTEPSLNFNECMEQLKDSILPFLPRKLQSKYLNVNEIIDQILSENVLERIINKFLKLT